MWKIVVDQMGYEVQLVYPPARIISVVPSQTELLADLGLDEEVVGITKFCVHPEHWFQTKNRVGGTKQINIERVKSLNPHLVIANKEENRKEDIDAIRQFCPVYTSDISNLDQALNMIRDLGKMTDKVDAAQHLCHQIMHEFEKIEKKHQRVAYLIWKNPYMAAGGDSFISSMMKELGWENVFADRPRYPVVSLEDLANADIQLLILSSEPYPFKMNDLEELSQILPKVKIALADGEMFSWYGSRMRLLPGYTREMGW